MKGQFQQWCKEAEGQFNRQRKRREAISAAEKAVKETGGNFCGAKAVEGRQCGTKAVEGRELERRIRCRGKQWR